MKFDVFIKHGHRTLHVTGIVVPGNPGVGPSWESAGGEPPEPAYLEDVTFRSVYKRKSGEIERPIDDDRELFSQTYDKIMDVISRE